MTETFIKDLPLCECVQNVVDRYNELPQSERTLGAHGRFFLAIRKVVHSCNTVKAIAENLLLNDVELWKDKQTELSKDDYIEELTASKKKFKEQAKRFLERITEYTDYFVYVNDFDYWVYYISNEQYKRIVKLLEQIELGTPQQPDKNKTDEVKKELHSHIFKGNAYDIWQSMFEEFKVTESSRTDLRFMYEVMKYNKQIHDTVTVKNITDWINEVYEFKIDKLHFTPIKSKSNNKRMKIYNLIK